MSSGGSLINPIEISRPDTCTKCGSDRSIECFDRNKRPLRYSMAIDLYEKSGRLSLDSRQLKYFKCNECNEEFKINWVQPEDDNTVRFPIPFTNILKLEYLVNMFGGTVI